MAVRASGCVPADFGTSFSGPHAAEHFHSRSPPSHAVIGNPAAAAIQNSRLYERAEIFGSELQRRLTDLRQTEKALEQSEEGRRVSEDKFQKVFRSSPISFSITTVNEGRFVDVNAAFERRYGYSRAEVIGRTIGELGIWEDPKIAP